MKTIITNVLTQKKELFVNEFTPKHNLISLIIVNKKQTGLILDKNHRLKIENEFKIVEKTSLNGDKIAFCYDLDLMARQK